VVASNNNNNNSIWRRAAITKTTHTTPHTHTQLCYRNNKDFGLGKEQEQEEEEEEESRARRERRASNLSEIQADGGRKRKQQDSTSIQAYCLSVCERVRARE